MSDSYDKTFDPTPQRIKKAREEGNVFRSQELNSVILLAFGLGTLFVGGAAGFAILQSLAERYFIGAASIPLTSESIPAILGFATARVMLVIVPFFLILGIVGIGLNVMQSGWNFTLKPLQPKGERISPLKGIKRIFSSRGLFTAAKSITKVVIVGPVAYLTIASRAEEIVQLHLLTIEQILHMSTSWILVLLARLLTLLLLLSAIDFAFEKWRYKDDLKMSHREIKDEMKENEGDPQIRVKRRQAARDLLRPRLDHAIMKSDVVVTNPTHYAVALRYDPTEAAAPRVMAKGIRKRAVRIKELAKEIGIPTIENRPLAQALYNSVDELQNIPEELYPAVAAILAEIYKLRKKKAA